MSSSFQAFGFIFLASGASFLHLWLICRVMVSRIGGLKRSLLLAVLLLAPISALTAGHGWYGKLIFPEDIEISSD
ncbi:hypothetical protein AO063_12790 [Pseudomonas fluorescens ICMP 11288]|uniref:Uncharacterized protein n=1 Tax=Pseudomonas fluorescens ICMP 11288 TaxID=1198309 RepID=A0A0W0I0Q7_PSEFL|nr:hypothetical protein AO063_12790 [Pseudomonas fluorescens ICMP 11288]